MPKATVFCPDGRQGDAVILTIEEYETIRLIDYVGLTQEECADFMQVSRTTAQQIYQDARRILAKSLVEGLPLRIQGGTYALCDQENRCQECRCRGKLRQEETV